MIDLYIKQYLGIIAIIIGFIAFAPYIKDILLNKIKPHAFSWIIWGVTTLIIFAAQVYDGAGAGSWSIGISGAVTLIIAILAYYKRSDDSIARIDWIFLFSSLSAIPIWYLTSNPLYSVIILTTIDIIGYGPTIRKSYYKPFEEQIMLFVLTSARNIVSIAALEHYSATNMLFQIATTIANIIVITVILTRRRVIPQDTKSDTAN